MPAKLGPTVRQVRTYIDFLHQYDFLSTRDLNRIHHKKFERAFARTILQRKKPHIACHEFSLVKLRSLTGKDFYAVLAVNRHLRRRRKLRAFVGHRFIPRVTNNLRHNLLLILKKYQVLPWYSDTDMPNTPVFETILRRIKKSNFCIFDDRETEIRPNVFIELGAAIAFGHPYFHLSFNKKRTVKIGRRRERIEVPSDFAGLLRLNYSDYEDLFLQFAMKFPVFLQDRGLAGPRPRTTR